MLILIIEINYFYPIKIKDVTDYDLHQIFIHNDDILMYYCSYDNSGYYVFDLYIEFEKMVDDCYKKIIVFSLNNYDAGTFYIIKKKDLFNDSKLISDEHNLIIKDLHKYAGYVSLTEGILIPKGLESIYDKIKINNE